MRIARRCAFLSLLILFTWAVPARAQFDSATVVGTVRDASRGVVPGAKVTLTAVGTGISTVRTSSDDGNYEFPAVKPGQYVVTAEKAGFALALVDNVQVEVGARRRVDLEMPLAQLTEKVQVTAASPLVETDSSQRGQVITGDQTRALPLISREYSALALLTTGVKLAGSSLTTGNTPREGAFNVNGIAATPDGSTLIVAHTADETVYTVNPSTGASAAIAGADLPNVDGILLEAGRL